jgi:hypothetical protein
MRSLGMKRYVRILGVLLVLASGSSSLVACGGPGVVEGTVTRILSGEVVTDGQVAVFALEELKGTGGLDIMEKGDLVVTENLDEKGTFSISLAPGDYVIEAWVPGVATSSSKIRVKSGQVTTANLQVKTPSD